MLLYARKKLIRDERVLQLVLLLSLLRGDPDSLLFGPGGSAPLADLPHDLILGPSLGHARSSSPLLAGGDFHPKSMDRMLADYQRSVLDDLNALGRYTAPSHHAHVHAYLLNTHTSLPSPPTADTPDHHHQGPDSPPTQPTNILPDPPPPESNLSEDDDLTPEDLALIEALWKQDVDLGVPREVFEEDGLEPPVDSQTKDKDHGKNPKSETKIDEKPDENPWMHFNFTIDSETGEHVLSTEGPISGGDVTLDPVSPLSPPSFTLNESVPDFNLEFNLDEALKLVGLNSSETGEAVWKSVETDSSSEDFTKGFSEEEKSSSDGGDSLDALSDTLDEMIQASQLNPHHPRSLQVSNALCSAYVCFSLSLSLSLFYWTFNMDSGHPSLLFHYEFYGYYVMYVEIWVMLPQELVIEIILMFSSKFDIRFAQ
ncbi:uncharacterized protein LOC122247585 [Penaeus japonicus]|uniref:uncharacterized protein LOC122247585 n=1 Tax=Penaeus japonicus TaxID=27405 RepID=UPI001C7137EC|nr:uncharacterized protein LOC122247585 [Penaeus japonicus]